MLNANHGKGWVGLPHYVYTYEWVSKKMECFLKEIKKVQHDKRHCWSERKDSTMCCTFKIMSCHFHLKEKRLHASLS